MHLFSYDSPLGAIDIASDGEAIIGLWFVGQVHYGSTLKGVVLNEMDEAIGLAIEWLDCYFGGGRPGERPLMRMGGSEFGRIVWETLLTIPYGETMSYGELGDEVARRMGRSCMSAQAVGGAVGRNPISLIVPCHRVIGADGGLRGYAGGLERKRALLALESCVIG